RDDTALRYVERDTLEHQDDVVVDHLDVVDREDLLDRRGGNGLFVHSGSHSAPWIGALILRRRASAVSKDEGVYFNPLVLRGAPYGAPQDEGSLSSRHDGLSQASVRCGQPVFFSTYSLAASSSIGRTFSFMGWIQSEIFTHLAPSHCCM